jgi:hypothetical protein
MLVPVLAFGLALPALVPVPVVFPEFVVAAPELP